MGTVVEWFLAVILLAKSEDIRKNGHRNCDFIIADIRFIS